MDMAFTVLTFLRPHIFLVWWQILVLFSNTRNYAYELEVKATDLGLLHLSFTFKFFTAHTF